MRENLEQTSNWLLSQNSQFSHSYASEEKIFSDKARIISVTGGKGGVGKTSISVKTAMELSAKGYKVLLIDCDYNLSNTSIKLGIPMDNSFMELITGMKEFDECLYKDGNFHLLMACNGSLELYESQFELEQFIIDIVRAHEHEYEFIVLDCPAGLQKETLTLNAYSDDRFFVITPDKSSITDSYSLIKILSQKYGIKENHILVNKAESARQYSKVVEAVSETVENFLGGRTHVLGYLQKAECTIDRFDMTFFYDKRSKIHHNFSKVINAYTEKLDEALLRRNAHCFSEGNARHSEQDVRSINF